MSRIECVNGGAWLLLAAGPLLAVAGVTGLVQSGGDVHDPATQGKALQGIAPGTRHE